MLDRRLIRDFDWLTLALTLVIAVLGCLGVYSATRSDSGLSPLFLDHVLRLGVGLGALTAALVVDYRFLVRHGYLIFLINSLMLAAVEAFGTLGMGAQRWLAVGGIRFQPSYSCWPDTSEV